MSALAVHVGQDVARHRGEVTEDGLFSIEHVNCLGACALGPIASENGNLGHHMTPAKLRKFIDSIRRKEREEVKNASPQH